MVHLPASVDTGPMMDAKGPGNRLHSGDFGRMRLGTAATTIRFGVLAKTPN